MNQQIKHGQKIITMKIMENRKTAMQELFDNLESIDVTVPIGVKKIFLEKEKELIINTFKGAQALHAMNDQMRGEQYYIETYGSEGSDAKDVVLGHKTSLDAQMLDRIEPKQEKLEEAAEKYANELPEPYNYGINSDKKKGFIEGAKWQQEQILQFLYSEIIERRPYSSSKMCEVVIEFIEQLNTKK